MMCTSCRDSMINAWYQKLKMNDKIMEVLL